MHRFRVVFWMAGLAIASFPAAGKVHDFNKWEKEISAYEAVDRTNPPPRNGVLFIGSSTIRLWKTLARDFPGQPVINRGFGGSEIADSTHFAERIIFPYEPRMILLRAGGNDLWAGKSPEEVFADYKEFLATVQARLPQTRIVFISWCPTIARWAQAGKERRLDDLVKAYTDHKRRLGYIESYDLTLGADGKPRAELLAADELHLNAEGYKLLAERVRPFLPAQRR